MKTLFLSNMSKSRNRTSTFFRLQDCVSYKRVVPVCFRRILGRISLLRIFCGQICFVYIVWTGRRRLPFFPRSKAISIDYISLSVISKRNERKFVLIMIYLSFASQKTSTATFNNDYNMQMRIFILSIWILSRRRSEQ